MKWIWLILLGGLILQAWPSSLHAASQGPAGDDVSFSSCPGSELNYRSVILAVHGWNGRCSTTFGNHDGSLFGIVGQRRFFDWDCFEYDSKKTDLETNISKLRARWRALHALGYREAILVTHSTGGVMALRALTDEMLRAPRTSERLRIVAIHAWATPINGLRAGVRGGGRILSMLGFSPETLPDLGPRSSFLRDLKVRLRRANEIYERTPPIERAGMTTRIRFYQGQGDDYVVMGIDEARARRSGWWWEGRAELVDTEEGHTHNVGAAGMVAVPRYPATILELRSLLELQVLPRYEDIFPKGVSSVSASMEERQRSVVDGVLFYAEEKRTSGLTPSLDFLRRMFQERFPRSARVDVDLVEGLAQVIEEHAANPDDDLVRFLDSFVYVVLADYDPQYGADVLLIGHGNWQVARRILELAVTVFDAVKSYLERYPEKRSLLSSYKTLEALEAETLELVASALRSEHGPVRLAALGHLEIMVPAVTDDVVARAGVLPKLTAFYLEDGGFRTAALPKERVQSIFVNLVKRGGALRAQTLVTLNASIHYRGQRRPAWAAFSRDADVERIVQTIGADAEKVSEGETAFLRGVVAEAGASGKNASLAYRAIAVYDDALSDIDETAQRAVLAEELLDAAAESEYPAVRDRAFEVAAQQQKYQ